MGDGYMRTDKVKFRDISEDRKKHFFSTLVKNGSCLEWTLKSRVNGYGITSVKQKQILAHRLSYIIHFGSIPDNMNILHSCDNRLCVNPEHLRPGTQKENIRDAIEKGRMFNKLKKRLSDGICLHGHIGQYVHTSRGSLACLECKRTKNREWMRKYYAMERAKKNGYS